MKQSRCPSTEMKVRYLGRYYWYSESRRPNGADKEFVMERKPVEVPVVRLGVRFIHENP
jgi:hypothetical protein